jgi:hypothetical protein
MPQVISLRRLVVVFMCLTALAAAQKDDAAGKTETRKADVAKRRASLTRESALAKARWERAKKDVTDQDADNAASLAKAEAEVAFAKQKMETFDQREAPTRTAKAKLDLQGAEDGAADAQDELTQLEMMYKNSEVGDGTKEMVLQRAKRGLERSKARLEIGRGELKTLIERTLPQERARLALDLAERERDLERAKRGAEKATFEKQLAVTAADGEVVRIGDELAGLEDAK